MHYIWLVIGIYCLHKTQKPLFSAAATVFVITFLDLVMYWEHALPIIMAGLTLFGYFSLWFWLLDSMEDILPWLGILVVGILVHYFIILEILESTMLCTILGSLVVILSLLYWFKFRHSAILKY